jgi:hypothetical protein
MKCTVPPGFDGTVEDLSMVMTSKQTVTTDMKNRTLQGGDSCPNHLAGIKGGQLRSHQSRSEVRRRRSNLAVNQRAFENEAELRREGFVIQKESSV